MNYFLVMNGAGRRPHVEEVETVEDVRSRLEIEDNLDDIIVIKGEMVQYKREEFLFIEDQAIKITPQEAPAEVESDAGQLPDWIQALRSQEEADEDGKPTYAPAASGSSEHPADVAGHADGEADEAPGDESGEGSDAGGDGASDRGGIDGDG